MKIKIRGEFIKLGQFLKKINIIDTGGQSKYFVEHHDIKINGNSNVKRSTKIFIGSSVWIDDEIYYIVSEDEK